MWNSRLKGAFALLLRISMLKKAESKHSHSNKEKCKKGENHSKQKHGVWTI